MILQISMHMFHSADMNLPTFLASNKKELIPTVEVLDKAAIELKEKTHRNLNTWWKS